MNTVKNESSSGLERCPTLAIGGRQFFARAVALGHDIKLSHSVFAMPLALLAAFLAAADGWAGHRHLPSAPALALIVVCMVTARTVAMTVNRLADARIDAANPRTAGRAIPSGRLSARFVGAWALLCAVLFITATVPFWFCWHNPWPLLLSPLALTWLCFYSFTKRFTWLCHLFLGSSLGLSPLAASLAIEPDYLTGPEPYLLAGMVLCWVAAFDIIYALQDVDIDRAAGLYSMPARLGVEPALWISRGLHALSLLLLLLLWHFAPSLGTGWLAGVGLIGLLLIVEHALVWRSRTRHLDVAFFTVNGAVSLILGGLGILDVVWHVAR
jgi:4-hydroxybenzoate polyprenyltransferase